MLFQKENNDRNSTSQTKNGFMHLSVIIVMFAAAFGIRCYRITEPDLYNHPARQYHSYNIARTFYHLNNDKVEDWQRKLAEDKYKNLDFKEPPLFEYIVAKTYFLANNEYLWIPKIYSISFWLIGGVLLYRLVIRFVTPLSAILALAYYLFSPFGFFTSRSFQPESLMTMFFIASILMIYRYFEKPSTKRLILSIIISAATILIKFIPLFPIFTAFLFMSFSKHNKDKMLFIKNSSLFFLTTALPSLIYYSYMYLYSGSIRSAANCIFLPGLLISPFFWKGWLRMLGVTIGLITAVGSIAGMIILKNKKAKILLAGLWIGYFIYGLIFSYSTATHDYYQVLLVPIAALSIAPVCQCIIKGFCKLSRKWQLSLAVFVIIIPLIPLYYLKNIEHDQFLEMNDNLKHKLEFACDIIGVNPHRLKRINQDYNDQVEMLRHIGNVVNHSANTIILEENYGHTVIYFSEINGKQWPNKGVIAYFKNVAKTEVISTQTRFNKILKELSPEYFIITDLESLELQPELKQLLDTRFEVLEKNDNFIIYDLKKTRPDQM